MRSKVFIISREKLVLWSYNALVRGVTSFKMLPQLRVCIYYLSQDTSDTIFITAMKQTNPSYGYFEKEKFNNICTIHYNL